MNITFVHDEPELYPVPAGGKERCVLSLANGFSERDEIDNIDIITRTADVTEGAHKITPKITLHKCSSYALPHRIIKLASKSDVCSSHVCSFQMPNINVGNCKNVYHLHDIIYATVDRGSHLDKSLSASYSAFYSPSEFVTDFVRKLFWWTDLGNKVITIPRGLDLNRVSQAIEKDPKVPEHVLSALESERPKVFFPSRLNSFKGETVLDVLAEKLDANIFIPSKNTDKLPNGAIALPWLSGENLYAFYAKMDLVIHPSLNPESFSQVIIDSIAAGTPVVCFPFGNMAPLASELPAVSAVEPTAEAMAIKANETLSDPNMGRLLKDSFSLLEEKYSIRQVIDEYMKSFDLLKQPERIPKAHLDDEKHYLLNPYAFVSGSKAYIVKGNDVRVVSISEDEQYTLNGPIESDVPQGLIEKGVVLEV